MSTISGVANFLPLLTFLLLVVPEVVALVLFDRKVESIGPPSLVLIVFDWLVAERITINTFLGGLAALGALELELATFGL